MHYARRAMRTPTIFFTLLGLLAIGCGGSASQGEGNAASRARAEGNMLYSSAE